MSTTMKLLIATTVYIALAFIGTSWANGGTVLATVAIPTFAFVFVFFFIGELQKPKEVRKTWAIPSIIAFIYAFSFFIIDILLVSVMEFLDYAELSRFAGTPESLIAHFVDLPILLMLLAVYMARAKKAEQELLHEGA